MCPALNACLSHVVVLCIALGPACKAERQARPSKPAVSCSFEAQDCPQPDTTYCTPSGACQPLPDQCPADWSWRHPKTRKPWTPPKVRIASEGVTAATPQASSASCETHPLLASYLSFAQRHRSQGHVSVEVAVHTIQSSKRVRRWACPATFSHLRRWLLEGTRLKPLVETLGSTTLTLRLESKREQPHVRRFTLEIPALGVVTGLIAWPKQRSPRPAVLLLHGHYGSAAAAFQAQGGEALVR